MLSALVAGLLAGAAAFVLAWLVARVARRLLHHQTNHYYRWGVLLFAVLIGVYTYFSNLGRP